MRSLLPSRAGSATPTIVNPWRPLALGATVLLAACASKPLTETGETTAAPAQQLVAADLDVVCRDVMVTGSHFPKHVCRTKKDWGEMEDSSKAFTRGLQSDATRNLAPAAVNPTPIGGAPVY